MSNEPISAPESSAFAQAVRAGWDPRELAWEDLQERAAALAASGAWPEAAILWSEALALGRDLFAADDPRLATSLTNHACALQRDGNSGIAQALLDEALVVWGASAGWIGKLEPERRARSSLFHLRLEQRHPGGYVHHSRERYTSLAAEGRAATRDHWRNDAASAHDRLERWRRNRPAGFTDARKLFAAALLIV